MRALQLFHHPQSTTKCPSLHDQRPPFRPSSHHHPHQGGVTFPSALVGMFGVFALLSLAGTDAATRLMGFYGPALNWVARWLPIFYVPALVTLPLALQGIPGACWRAAEVESPALPSVSACCCLF
jgi:hypothetical protein